MIFEIQHVLYVYSTSHFEKTACLTLKCYLSLVGAVSDRQGWTTGCEQKKQWFLLSQPQHWWHWQGEGLVRSTICGCSLCFSEPLLVLSCPCGTPSLCWIEGGIHGGATTAWAYQLYIPTPSKGPGTLIFALPVLTRTSCCHKTFSAMLFCFQVTG